MEVIKTVKQYSIYIDNYSEFEKIAERYRKVKNYIYSRYSGINSILLLNRSRKLIRDEWVKTKFAEQWKLPARYWKMALSEAISNIKSIWSNTKIKIKECINRNSNLTKEELHYIRYILKCDNLYYKVLTHEDFDLPIKFKNSVIRICYIHNMICRLTRRYKGSVPYSYNSRSFMIDADMYTYEVIDDLLYINIMSTNRGKRIRVKLTDKNMYTGNLRVIIEDGNIQIHKPLIVKSKKIATTENIIAIDKGYRHLLTVSNGKFYGEKLNELLNKETERLKEVNAKRNQLYALEKKYREQGNTEKADNILYNNLGKLKYKKHKQKYDAKVKSYINHSINKMLEENKPSELVMEQLDFVSWNDRYPKHVKRKLSRWIKGYIKEKLEYKCLLNEVIITYINPAYTSKVCNVCGDFGKRNGDVFTCPKCGKIHADYNASINILNRKYDNEITLYTNYKKVKEILEKRIS